MVRRIKSKRRTRRGRTRNRQRGGNQPIIVLQTRWGLGNQIMQYCIGCAVQKRFGYKMFILPPIENVHANNKDYRDLFTRGEKIDAMPDNFMTTEPYIAKKNGEPLKISDIPEGKNIYLELLGHFYEVFEHIMPELAKEMHSTLNKLYPDLEFKNDTKSGFIHVRRGDFITNGWGKDFKFYNSAIKKANSESNVKTWHMFSDDLNWCKSQAWDNPKKIKFVDEPDELKTLAIMSNCLGGAVLAQSTFGWAGAAIGSYQHNAFIIAHIDIINHSGGGKYIGPSDWIYMNDDGNLQEYK
jgi:hypothetical protein